MTARPTARPVRFVLDAEAFVEDMTRMRSAVQAHPRADGEDSFDWLRRVVDALYWRPDGYDSSEAPSPTSDEDTP